MLLRPMHASAVVVALAIVFAMAGCKNMNHRHSQSESAHSGNAQQEVNTLMDQYTDALLKKDSATLDRIWADDLTFINPRGELVTKQQRMENIRTGATAFKSINVTDKRIRTYGHGEDMAVATCRVAVEGQYSSQEGSGNYNVTTVWHHKSGTWQMVAVQMTKMGQ